MANSSETVQMSRFDELSLFDRYQYGIDLSHAVASNPQLKVELPYAAAGYRTPLRAIRRLGKVARKAPENHLSPYVVTLHEQWPYDSIQPSNIRKDNQLRPRASGIATALNYYGNTAPPVLEVSEEESTEVSYWLRRAKGENESVQLDLGSFVLNELLNAHALDNVIWSVTLPEDTTKAAALDGAGFRPLASPDLYKLGDGCTAPRQLWHLR